MTGFRTVPGFTGGLEDAQRAIGSTRFHLGFSADGHLVAATSVHFAKRVYANVDRADEQNWRPDFAVALYPGHLSMEDGTLELTPDIAKRIGSQTPPTFLGLQNEDEAALIEAHVPVEFHSYAEGGHAFGLRRTGHAATRWPTLVERWLRSIGMIPRRS